MTISAGQIRAARAILGWSQDEIAAKADLSTTTIYNLEKSRNLEKCQVTLRSALEVRKTFEMHGLEFLDGDGVRRRIEDIAIYRGPNSCELFFEDMLGTAEDHGEEIIAVVRSQDILCQALGTEGIAEPARLRQLAELTGIRCVFSEIQSIAFVTPSCQFRFSPKHHVGAAHFVCGDKYAIIMSEGCGTFKFVVFKSTRMAQSARHDFTPLWDAALPVMIQSPAQ